MSLDRREWNLPNQGLLKEITPIYAAENYHFFGFQFDQASRELLTEKQGAYILFLRPFNAYQSASTTHLRPTGLSIVSDFEEQLPGAYYAVFRGHKNDPEKADLSLAISHLVVGNNQRLFEPDPKAPWAFPKMINNAYIRPDAILDRDAALAKTVNLIQAAFKNPTSLINNTALLSFANRPKLRIQI